VVPGAPVTRIGRWALALSSLAAGCLLAHNAQADVSSWVYAGFGPAYLKDVERDRYTLQLETGIGTPPAAIVAGGLFRVQPYFGEGTDLALLARVATRGFVQGGFGLALDAGGYQRFWGEGSTGGLGSLVLGLPWGINLSASGGMGSNDAKFASLTLGLDFARLTVYRTHGTNWFSNPHATDERGRGPR
jgi:hypothetical protein